MVTDTELAKILSEAKTVAVVGISNNPARASYGVSAWLQRQGFRIIPVNPGQKEVLGEKAIPSLEALTEAVDIVNVFRRSDQVLPVVEQAVKLRPKLIFLQEGISNDQAAQLAQENGIPFVMDRCILKELSRLVPWPKAK